MDPNQPNPILKFFAYEHLPPQLQEVSKPLGDLAREMAAKLPPNAETRRAAGVFCFCSTAI